MKFAVSVFFTLLLCGAALPQTPRIVTAPQANGTYGYRQNEIKILALGHNKLRIQMDLIFAYKSPAGPTANTGEASGEATIENDTAIFIRQTTISVRSPLNFWRAIRSRSAKRTLSTAALA